MNSRRIFLRRLLWTAMGAVASSAQANFGARPVRAGLATSGRFAFLPLRAVEPLGWLREQLQIQASGLSGHLEEVWKDVGPGSGWLGGKGESWETIPGRFATVDRAWEQGDRVEILLPMKPRNTRWFRQSVAVERGPVVFSLPVRGKWSKVVDRGSASDWQVVPEDDWNYALDLSDRTKDSIRVIEREARRRVHRIGCFGPLEHEGQQRFPMERGPRIGWGVACGSGEDSRGSR